MKKVAGLTVLALVLMAAPAQARTIEGNHYFRSKSSEGCEAVRLGPTMLYCDALGGHLAALYRFPNLTGRADVQVACDCDGGKGFLHARWLPERGVVRVSERAGIGVVYSVTAYIPT